ncbi:MAG: hypothetical protein E6J74_39405, partial [Deltaproteobacteria bacterium]
MKCHAWRVAAKFLCVAIAALFFASSLSRAAQGPDLKPEKSRLEVAIAATGPLYLPIILANEAGYFNKRGVTVNTSVLSATASA